MRQPSDEVHISFEEDHEGSARSTVKNIRWCRAWEITREGRIFVLSDIDHAFFNLEWLTSIKRELVKAGVWHKMPYRGIVDQIINDSRLIIGLMSAAKSRAKKPI
jgi:hypothetical protein